MWKPYSARIPWIVVRQDSVGFVVRDTRSGKTVNARDAGEVARFAAAHSATPGFSGLGDAVRGLTRRLGVSDCTPCAKRQAALNAAVPRLFRRS